MIKKIIPLLLCATSSILDCSAMKEQIKSSLILFPILPAELSGTIFECITNSHRLAWAVNDTMKTINAFASINKESHKFVTQQTDQLIKDLSINFGVSNEFITLHLNTVQAHNKALSQRKLFKSCLIPQQESCLSALINLSLEYPHIDWNFTYSYAQCLHMPQCKKNKCIRKYLKCSHQPPHPIFSFTCSDIATQRDCWTPIMIMCKRFSDKKLVEFLIQRGADINAVTRCGKNTPMINFIFYVQRGRVTPLLDLFLNQPTFNVNYADSSGDTYLMLWLSCLMNDFQLEQIRKILNHGADPETINKHSQSVLSLVDPINQPQIFHILSEAIQKKYR